MDSENGASRPSRRLTSKQAAFVRLFVAEGYTQIAAYRAVYATKAGARAASNQAYRLARTPGVRAAIQEIQNGKLATNTILTDSALLSLQRKKKLYTIAENPDTPPYVSLRALELAAECEQRERDRNPQKKAETAEEINRLLADAMKGSPGIAPADGYAVPDLGELEDFSLEGSPKKFGSGRESPRATTAAAAERPPQRFRRW